MPPVASPILYNFEPETGWLLYSRKPMDSFLPTELERALNEQSFAIAGFELMTSTSPLEASALVTLLEGDVVRVSLSARGYQLTRNPHSGSPPEPEIFEAIEALLGSSSPLYEKKRSETLFARLETLS